MTAQGIPSWIHQIAVRSDYSPHSLKITFPAATKTLYLNYIASRQVSILDDRAPNELIIAFPINRTCNTWEEMAQLFKQQFGDYLFAQHGDVNPLDGN